jgi:penicillin-binding protein 1A
MKRSGSDVSSEVEEKGAQKEDEPAEVPKKEPFKKRFLRGLKKWSKRVGIATLAFAIASVITLVLVVRHFEKDLPQVSDLKKDYHPPQVTRVLARDGTVLAEIFTERRTVISIDTLPAHVKLAVLAAEDAGFYEHEGLNYWGILRAMLVNARSGKIKQGGSTITQQVVKNTLTGPDRDYRRKIREALLARRLEQELKKDEILELYLNQIYFGQGRYGIEEAARHTFGKGAKDLTIAEAAMLAGTIANPEHYSPRADMNKAMQRRSYVLGQMKDKGFLAEAQYDVAMKEEVRLGTSLDALPELAPEVVEVAKKTLYDLAPEIGPRGGFTIYTTIDPKLQAAARKALRDALVAYDKRHGLSGPLKPPPGPATDKRGHVIKPPPPKDPPFEGTPRFEDHKILIGTVTGADDVKGTIDVKVGSVPGTIRMSDVARYNPSKLSASAFAPRGALVRVSLLAPPVDGASAPLRLESGPEGALVAIDTRTKNVLALVGNYEAVPGGLDRAMQSRRQPGSTFKPIVYSYALHTRRYTAASLLDPNPTQFGNYRPANYEGWKGTDPIRLREAIASSVNVAAVRVLDDVGPQGVVAWAQSLGISSTLKPDLSLALGSYEVRPIELCGAYAAFASGGTYEEPKIISKIVGPDGREVELPPPIPPRSVLDEAEAYLTTSLLTSVVDHGTAVRAKSLGRPVAGKTGTSNNAKDTWFAGYSTDVVAVVWVGYDDGKSLGVGETGASVALPAWIDFMKAAHEHKPATEFPRPAGLVTVSIDPKTGKRVTPDTEGAIEELFLSGTEPTETAEASDADAGALHD